MGSWYTVIVCHMKSMNCLSMLMGLWYIIKYNVMQNFLREAGVGMAFVVANITAAAMKSKFKLLSDILTLDEMALSNSISDDEL